MGKDGDETMVESILPEAATNSKAEAAPELATPNSLASAPEQFRPEILKLYYKWLFPFEAMYRWLSYGNDRKIPGSDQGEKFFLKREFSFTLENDIYVRYQSFKDAADLEAKIIEKCPHKIDIGAVYSIDLAKKNQHQGTDRFLPVERELVFDIDMTDYDDMRRCCTGAKVCELCWTLMTVAIKVVDHVLREDFGFEHILWVFSGRRGVHCWVCDSRARKLSDEQRSSIAEYFRVYKGSEGNTRKVAFSGPTLHPALMRAYEKVLLPYFEGKILADQLLLEDESAWSGVLANIPDEDVKDTLAERWRSDRKGGGPEANVARWRQLESTVRQAAKKNTALRKTVEEIVFGYSYPRLDLEVSKHMNHLLKAPFCVHPKTGKVCVPIDPATCEEFSPNQVPTLSRLMEELNETGASTSGSTGAKETSLGQYIKLFETTFLDKLSATVKEELIAKQKEKVRQQRAEATVEW